MIDTNEIAGWISNCTNAEYLRQIRYAIEKRIEQLVGREQAKKVMSPRSKLNASDQSGQETR